MTTSELMKAMADAGAPFDAILIAVQALEAKDAELAAREAEIAEKRASNAERQQRFRDRRKERKSASEHRSATRNVTRNATDNVTSNVTPPIDITHTPSPDISPDGESQSSQRADDCAAVVSTWNAMAKATGLSTCQKFTDKRRRACRARLKDDGLDAIQRAIARIPQSSFLRGDTGSWGGADFDFLLRPDSVTKILEGKYDDRDRPQQPVSRSAGPRGERRNPVLDMLYQAEAEERAQQYPDDDFPSGPSLRAIGQG